MKRDDTSEKSTAPHGCEPDYDANGVDRTLLRWFSSLTPTERLRHAQRQATSILELRRRNGIR